MIKIETSIYQFEAAAWNACVPDNHPFLKHEFFQALEISKCIGKEAGWIPFYIAQFEDKILVAILPVYLKNHSYGEFIFDWAWAQAYEKYNLPYYPKLTMAVPHSPVSAPKFISKAKVNIAPFISEIDKLIEEHHCSSSHFLFTSHEESNELEKYNYTCRHSIQFHWQNRGYKSFDDFLATLRKDKRKNIKKEREKLNSSGLVIIEKSGEMLSQEDADYLTDIYFKTIEKKWSQAYLNRIFFRKWIELQKDQTLLIMAYQDEKPIGAAIHLFSETTLFGRYWGCSQEVPYLHFELCYYRAMEYAIKHNLKVVEAGAQGEQKLVRGFEPTLILSNHKILHTGFSRAINAFILNEREHIQKLKEEYNLALPFKR